MWYVYILQCKNKAYYTGIAKNVEERFNQHLCGQGAKYTRANPPVKIVYVEKCADHSAAAQREVQIKKLSRAQKQALTLSNRCKNDTI